MSEKLKLILSVVTALVVIIIFSVALSDDE